MYPAGGQAPSQRTSPTSDGSQRGSVATAARTKIGFIDWIVYTVRVIGVLAVLCVMGLCVFGFRTGIDMVKRGKEVLFDETKYTYYEVGLFACAMAVYFELVCLLLLCGEIRSPCMQRNVLKHVTFLASYFGRGTVYIILATLVGITGNIVPRTLGAALFCVGLFEVLFACCYNRGKERRLQVSYRKNVYDSKLEMAHQPPAGDHHTRPPQLQSPAPHGHHVADGVGHDAPHVIDLDDNGDVYAPRMHDSRAGSREHGNGGARYSSPPAPHNHYSPPAGNDTPGSFHSGHTRGNPGSGNHPRQLQSGGSQRRLIPPPQTRDGRGGVQQQQHVQRGRGGLRRDGSQRSVGARRQYNDGGRVMAASSAI